MPSGLFRTTDQSVQVEYDKVSIPIPQSTYEKNGYPPARRGRHDPSPKGNTSQPSAYACTDEPPRSRATLAWFCSAAGGRPAMTKDIVVICAGMLAVSVGVWTFWGNPQSTTPARAEVVRILADDPALKFASETSPYMRTER
jgi:hypothetical protein